MINITTHTRNQALETNIYNIQQWTPKNISKKTRKTHDAFDTRQKLQPTLSKTLVNLNSIFTCSHQPVFATNFCMKKKPNINWFVFTYIKSATKSKSWPCIPSDKTPVTSVCRFHLLTKFLCSCVKLNMQIRQTHLQAKTSASKF